MKNTVIAVALMRTGHYSAALRAKSLGTQRRLSARPVFRCHHPRAQNLMEGPCWTSGTTASPLKKKDDGRAPLAVVARA